MRLWRVCQAGRPYVKRHMQPLLPIRLPGLAHIVPPEERNLYQVNDSEPHKGVNPNEAIGWFRWSDIYQPQQKTTKPAA